MVGPGRRTPNGPRPHRQFDFSGAASSGVFVFLGRGVLSCRPQGGDLGVRELESVSWTPPAPTGLNVSSPMCNVGLRAHPILSWRPQRGRTNGQINDIVRPRWGRLSGGLAPPVRRLGLRPAPTAIQLNPLPGMQEGRRQLSRPGHDYENSSCKLT